MKKRRAKKQKPASSADKEKPCKHQWAALMAQRGKKVVAVPLAKICIKCGLLQVGTDTIKISRFRLDMGSLSIKSVGKLYMDASGKLRIPVGTNLYE